MDQLKQRLFECLGQGYRIIGADSVPSDDSTEDASLFLGLLESKWSSLAEAERSMARQIGEMKAALVQKQEALTHVQAQISELRAAADTELEALKTDLAVGCVVCHAD